MLHYNVATPATAQIAIARYCYLQTNTEHIIYEAAVAAQDAQLKDLHSRRICSILLFLFTFLLEVFSGCTQEQSERNENYTLQIK